MPRSLSAPGYSQGFNGPLPVGFGGTGSNTASGALESLGGVSKSQILDPATGKIKQDAIVGGGVGGGSGGDSWTYVAITANATLTPFAIGHVKTAGVTVKLPASPAVNTRVRVVVDDFTNTNLDGNGSSILGVSGELFEIDTANQVIELGYFDTWRLISSSIIGAVAGSTPTATTSDVSVMGPVSLVVNEVGVYKITNYDIGTTYTVSSTLGTVSVSLDTITYLPGGVAGNGGFIINGKSISIEVNSSRQLGNKITKLEPKCSIVSTSHQVGGCLYGSAVAMSSDKNLFSSLSMGAQGPSPYTYGVIEVLQRIDGKIETIGSLHPSQQSSISLSGVTISGDGDRIAFGTGNSGSGGQAFVEIYKKYGEVFVREHFVISAAGDGYTLKLNEAGDMLLSANFMYANAHYTFYKRTGAVWGAPIETVVYVPSTYISATSDLSKFIVPVSDGSGIEWIEIYAFNGDNYTLAQKIGSNDLTSERYFSMSGSFDISDDGNTIANLIPTTNTLSVFKKLNGEFKRKLIRQDLDSLNYGDSNSSTHRVLKLSADGSKLFIGNPYGYHETANVLTGFVDIFDISGTTIEKIRRIYPSGPVPGSGNRTFGQVIEISKDGSCLMIGDPMYGSGTGSVILVE